MGKETERSAEMRRALDEYAASGLSRREFCGQRRIALTTFDYWRREHAMKARKQERRLRFVKVEVAASEAAGQGFTLNLANGRRIESSWRFVEAELARLIRIAVEAVDMRKGFEGLHGLVRDHLGQDPPIKQKHG